MNGVTPNTHTKDKSVPQRRYILGTHDSDLDKTHVDVGTGVVSRAGSRSDPFLGQCLVVTSFSMSQKIVLFIIKRT